jgi:tetratricopeptide (TPR) repeat protein
LKPLEPPDAHHLLAAQGWLELGNSVEANKELEQIAPPLRAHPNVLEMRWRIYAKTSQWEACVDLGNALVNTAPDLPEGWIHRSYALHELKRTREALELLEPAADLFPSVWLIPYNLACYSCQLGNQTEAWEWLSDAFDLGDQKAIKLMALDDPDLEPFWMEIGEI